MSIGAESLLYRSSFLRVRDDSTDFELAFATRVVRMAVERAGSLTVCPSVCVQRAALKTPPPFGRTLSFPESAMRVSEVRTPAPRQAVVPFRRFRPVAEGVGRGGTPYGQACTADSGTNQRNGA
ncbi:hypothetical protein [Granulicella sp. dw_53]|uniref:hypothetical protein n=1 Tax=Granulicella sp. dw_53 TaxID=2719792 RepID=UPI001BD47523|nr:hypothetical protein [Granulicella sp. dw_53]